MVSKSHKLPSEYHRVIMLNSVSYKAGVSYSMGHFSDIVLGTCHVVQVVPVDSDICGGPVNMFAMFIERITFVCEETSFRLQPPSLLQRVPKQVLNMPVS